MLTSLHEMSFRERLDYLVWLFKKAGWLIILVVFTVLLVVAGMRSHQPELFIPLALGIGVVVGLAVKRVEQEVIGE